MSDTPSEPGATPDGPAADLPDNAPAPPFDLNALQGLEEVTPAVAEAKAPTSDVEEATLVAPVPPAGAASPDAAAAVLPAPEVLARVVVGWHNRLPWARRLKLTEVSGVGLVRLHFESDGEGLGPALFHEPALVPGVSQRQLERLARQHGFVEPPGEAGWPVRAVGAAPAQGGAVRYLMTASVPAARAGAAPWRLLMGRSHLVRWQRRTATPIRGRRAIDRRRLGWSGALLLTILLLLAGLAWWLTGRGAAHGSAEVAHSAEPAASAASAASAPVAASEPAEAPSEAASASESEPAASEPASVALAALAASEASAPADTAPVTSHWALVSRPYHRPDRQAADLRLLKVAAAALPGDIRVDVLHTADGPVLTLWPLPDQAGSEQLVERLARQGLALRAIQF